MRYRVIAAFVNMAAAGVARFIPAEGDPRDLAKGERVTPPGDFETTDKDQAERLTRAAVIRAVDGSSAATAGKGSGGDAGTGKAAKGKGKAGRGAASHAAGGDAGSGGEGGSGSEGTGDAGSASQTAGGANAGDAAGSGDAGSGSASAGGSDGGRGGDGTESHNDGRGIGQVGDPK